MQPTDQELLKRMSAGDERALAAFYDRHATLAYSIAYHILGNRADAEEIVSDVFVYAWRSAAVFDPARASAAAWISVITRSRALDRLRSSKRQMRVVEAVGESRSEAVADINVETADVRRRINEVLAELPPEQRSVIELAYFRGFSHSEIAEALKEPLGTVKTRLRSALGKLRSALSAYQFTE